jgi:hypothetical protein
MRGVCAAILLSSLSAQAAKAGAGMTLAIPELETPPNMMGLGGQVVKQVEESAREQGFTVLRPGDVETRLGPEGMARLRQCAGQPGCYAARLRPLGAQRAVVGSLSRNEKAYLLKLSLVDLGTGTVVADVDRSILIASRRLQQDVAEAVPRLLRGEGEARGTLKVTTTVRNAQVLVDGQPVGVAPVELELKPGKYEVRLEKRSYLPVKRLVDVFADKVTHEEVRLLLEPGATPEEETLPALVAEAPGQTEDAAFGIRAPAWVALGVAAVTGGAGGYYGLSASRTQERLESSFDPERGAYGLSRVEAQGGQREARTANMFFAASAAAATAAIVFTVLDLGGPARVSPVPQAGPGGAGVAVGGSF